MTTTTESNMLNMHQSPLVLGWGQNNINQSYPINAKRLQIVFPSSGNAQGWQPNSNLEFRQLLDKNSAMSLHGSYFKITYQVGRSVNFANENVENPAALDGGTGQAANRVPKGAPTSTRPITSADQLAPLDHIDKYMMYSHWNPCRLIQNCTLWLGSTNVETVNNLPLITDAKYAFYSPDAVKTTMSDCFVQPPDGSSSLNGAPYIFQQVSWSTDLIFRWYFDYSLQVVNQPGLLNDANGPASTTGQPPYANQWLNLYGNELSGVQPLEYVTRNAQYSRPIGTADCFVTSAITNNISAGQFGFEALEARTSGSGADPPNVVAFFNYGYRNIIENTQISAVGNENGAFISTATGPVYPISCQEKACGLVKTNITRRIPLSEMFGFAEQNVLVPSNLLQINLVRANDSQFVQKVWTASNAVANQGVYSLVSQQREYGIYVDNIQLVLKYYDLNQSAADILSQDQLLTVNHYSVYSNQIKGLTNGSVALQSYAGLKSLLIRQTAQYGMPGQSQPLGVEGSISVIYRGKQSPLQLQQWKIQPAPPATNVAAPYNAALAGGGGVGNFMTYPGGPLLDCDPSTYFEEYSSWNGNAFNGVSASLAPSAGFNLSTWAKSQFTVAFNFVEDQSQNSDTVAAPVQLNYSLGQVPAYQTYPYDSASDGVVAGKAPMLPPGVNTDSYTIQVVFMRTNILKYLGASRQFVFVTNGSS